jgi:hypothetical protein
MTWPTRNEACAFVDEYLRVRGRPLAHDEKQRLDAAAIYAMAYTARCEHSLGSVTSSSMAESLRTVPDAYFG